jgi:hypothetical protein
MLCLLIRYVLHTSVTSPLHGGDFNDSVSVIKFVKSRIGLEVGTHSWVRSGMCSPVQYAAYMVTLHK